MIVTLDDALANGRGNERPFCCPVHGDTTASASVNVLKGVWFCYACSARGVVGKKTAPSADLLAAMLEPEKAARHYPEAYLEIFDPLVADDLPKTHWRTRFPDWLVHTARLGHDPVTGDATFPVRTPLGRLAGVGRRQEVGQPRYRFPAGWSASRTLHGYSSRRSPVWVLVEGAADQCSLVEIGVPALGCYSAGLHIPQLEMLMRRSPKLVALAFDNDKAGDSAAARAEEVLTKICDTVRVQWPDKDPAASSPDARAEVLAHVGLEQYLPEWRNQAEAMKRTYDDDNESRR